MALTLGIQARKYLISIAFIIISLFIPPIVLFAFDSWLAQKHGRFIVFSAAAILIFRGELAILLGLILFGELVNRRLSLSKYIIRNCIDLLLSLFFVYLVGHYSLPYLQV